MAKYHINAKGVPAICRAEKGGCPFGGEGDHYDTPEQAQEAADKQNAEQSGWLAGATEESKENSLAELKQLSDKNFSDYQEFARDGQEDLDNLANDEDLTSDEVEFEARSQLKYYFTSDDEETDNQIDKIAKQVADEHRANQSPERTLESIQDIDFQSEKDYATFIEEGGQRDLDDLVNDNYLTSDEVEFETRSNLKYYFTSDNEEVDKKIDKLAKNIGNQHRERIAVPTEIAIENMAGFSEKNTIDYLEFQRDGGQRDLDVLANDADMTSDEVEFEARSQLKYHFTSDDDKTDHKIDEIAAKVASRHRENHGQRKEVLKNLSEGYNIKVEELESAFKNYGKFDEDSIQRVYDTKNQLVRDKLRSLKVPSNLIDCMDTEKAYTELTKKNDGKTIELSDGRYIKLV